MAPLLSILGITLNPLTLAKDLVGDLLTTGLGLFGKGASSLVGALLGFVNTTTDPVFSGGWWSASGQALFERMLAVSGGVMALAFMCSIITAVISADHSLLARAALRLPLAAIEMVLLVAVTGALVSGSDEVAAFIAKGATSPLSSFVSGAMVTSIADTGVVGLIVGGLVILAALCVWAELICRSALIYVAVMAGPLIFAASVHPSVRGLQRRYVEGALALILSKVVVAIAFATGSAMLSGLGHSSSFAAATGALLQALAVLLVACFAPFVLIRLLVGAEAILAAEGLERRPLRAAVASYASPVRGGFAQMVRGLGGPGTTPGSASGGPPGGSGGPPTGGAGPGLSTPGPSGGSSSRPPVPPAPMGGARSTGLEAPRAPVAARPSAPPADPKGRAR